MSFDLKLFGGDLVIQNGDLAIVEDSDKLTQDILKLVSTQLGSNPFFPAYGSPVSQVLIGTSDVDFAQDVATQQLRASIERLKDLQQNQIKSNQIVTAEEQISAVQNVSIVQAKDDPRYYFVNLTVINKAFQSVPISFAVVTS
jgi:phage baseplate assembly protein W